MKKMTLMLAVSALVVLAGCSDIDNYAPAETTSGEEMFSRNCTICHKPGTGEVMRLSADMASKGDIVNKLHKGSMGMPAFPNIKGEAADRLAEYVLANSKPK